MIEPFGFIAAGSAASKCLQPRLGVNPGPKAPNVSFPDIAGACGGIALQVSCPAGG